MDRYSVPPSVTVAGVASGRAEGLCGVVSMDQVKLWSRVERRCARESNASSPNGIALGPRDPLAPAPWLLGARRQQRGGARQCIAPPRPPRLAAFPYALPMKSLVISLRGVLKFGPSVAKLVDPVRRPIFSTHKRNFSILLRIC